eukprot:CAMPEP_0171088970 /NCGR_PEP_ID=MMETSP0766_2-20121228/21096_1 /TAXON_ID=439317 /ORGANISM="Gambierdiscus australes, Strain CAWD 149" /LENGTH=265 /DNA_ID=CAMNT_0011546795 /DNA_START=1 /DNA_END=798 /DNA_ORIENTATION=+
MGHCPVRDIFAEPPWGHDKRSERICALNKHGHMTRRDFTRPSTLQFFRDAVDFFRTVAYKDWHCINVTRGGRALPSLAWGFKEPHYAWLLPAMDRAFNNHSRYLIIARDPRDMCTNKIQDQFNLYSKCLRIRGTCFHFWAEFWQRLLAAYEFNPRFAVLRIEDLVVPDPATTDRSRRTLSCLLDHVGVQPRNGTRMMKSLARFHKHNASYMGHHNNISAANRARLEQRVSGMKEVHDTMRRLGYHPHRFELLQPTSRAVLCRGEQ